MRHTDTIEHKPHLKMMMIPSAGLGSLHHSRPGKQPCAVSSKLTLWKFHKKYKQMPYTSKCRIPSSSWGFLVPPLQTKATFCLMLCDRSTVTMPQQERAHTYHLCLFVYFQAKEVSASPTNGLWKLYNVSLG